MSWRNNQQSTQPSKYYKMMVDGVELKVKRCEELNCNREIFYDKDISKFIDLEHRNVEGRNWHWSYCTKNPASQGQQMQFQGGQQQPQQSQQQNYQTTPNSNNYTGVNSSDHVSRETLQDVMSEIQVIKSKLFEIEKNQYMTNDESKAVLNAISQIVNNWIQNNPIQNALFQFIETFKEYLPPPQYSFATADKLKESRDSMNSDDINPLSDEEDSNNEVL